MHAQADAEERNLALPGIGDRLNFAFHTATAEATGYEYAVAGVQFVQIRAVFKAVCADILQGYLGVVGNATVNERLVQTLVGFGQINIFAGNADSHRSFRVLDPANQLLPGFDIGRTGPDPQFFEDAVI